jgi:ribose transport system permease protein
MVSEPRSRGTSTLRWLRNAGRSYGIVWATLFSFVVISTASDSFLTGQNLRNILDQQVSILIVGAAVTVTMIAGHLDISLSAVFILSAAAAVQVENATGSAVAAVFTALAVGVAAGAVNGVLVVVGKVTSFIATLATSFIFFGLGYVVSAQSILTPNDPAFADIARTRWLGISTSSWVAIAFVIVVAVLLSQTRYGRYVYAVGTNVEAARLSGVRTSLVPFTTFLLGGFAAGLAGVLATSRVMSVRATDDFSLVFAVITAIVVGGTSISGGYGAIWRTVLGAAFIAFAGNGFDLLGIDPIYQRMIRGGIILAAVWIDARSRTRVSGAFPSRTFARRDVLAEPGEAAR